MGQFSLFLLATCLLALFHGSEGRRSVHSKRGPSNRWIPTWGNMPQLTESANLPSPPFNVTGEVFGDSTIRQTIHTSIAGSQIRLQFSNAFGIYDLPITAVTVALPANGSAGTNAINTKTLKPVTFSGSSNYTIPGGALVVSDPIDMAVAAQSILTITMYLADGQQSNLITSHPGSRTTSYWTDGNQVSAASLTGSTLTNGAHWYFLTSVEVSAPSSSRAFVIVGDSITDGRGSDTDKNNRWPDLVLAKMQKNRGTSNIAVINKAAGGNRILYDGLGPNALGRIDRDVLAQPGLTYAMIFEGVNDIGTASNDTASQKNVGDRIIAAYKQIALRLEAFDVPFFAATITPFSAPNGNVALQPYTDPTREAMRQRVNSFIRSSGLFDSVVDFDAILRNSTHPNQLQDQYNSGDYLHPNVKGYQLLADKFPLNIFD
ncbi:hypothetical protein LSUE1_G004036 [Lachnellula suecica]|uniref:SGNH hydrolase-type esterase domain-containing protein n=1 Tax=Lachnellula suecica TaxID=602035 RepID=A0A8T9CEK5_9HELO|nr:hypothetical protein LSUE1_G004036 [Lachnellula suecica]